MQYYKKAALTLAVSVKRKYFSIPLPVTEVNEETMTFNEHYFSKKIIRLPSVEVNVGVLKIGSQFPVRIQSMTNTDTNDVKSSVNQTIELIEAGCDMVRLTAQGVREAENLAEIKNQIRAAGFNTPLIADIHFNPKAAEAAARIVEKIRINPGNFIPSTGKRFIDYSESAYYDELEYTREKLKPVIDICKQYGTAVRIGVNHGSLGNRIISRFGDTPEGMAMSAVEFIDICESLGFKNLVLSMKSSNVKVMVAATRLLADKMLTKNAVFPLHLGVTEAGFGEDGIIKSACGIGALLIDGLGDTIRVSLTGSPVAEIPVAKEILRQVEELREMCTDEELPHCFEKFSPLNIGRRKSEAVGVIGGNNPIQIIHRIDDINCLMDETASAAGVVTESMQNEIFEVSGNPRQARFRILQNTDDKPVIIKNKIDVGEEIPAWIFLALNQGTLLLDGLGDAIQTESDFYDRHELCRIQFAVLQATRARISKTEYISCPSCGRTLFNIEDAVVRVKEATSHLKNLKIAVMGCIVNGPGEMADADYGYVGAGKGLVNLYKSKELRAKNISEEKAIEFLKNMIKENGDWLEPTQISL